MLIMAFLFRLKPLLGMGLMLPVLFPVLFSRAVDGGSLSIVFIGHFSYSRKKKKNTEIGQSLNTGENYHQIR